MGIALVSPAAARKQPPLRGLREMAYLRFQA
jgi:hypothetical protein